MVNLSEGGVSLADLLSKAKAARATAVAVRTTATNFDLSIPTFHNAALKVLAWCWPPVDRERALDQARQVVELMRIGLDGFIVDPEGDIQRPQINWDLEGLDELAREYCSTIRDAFPDKLFGTTSHYRAKRIFRNLPWGAFVESSDRVYPQAYWRVQTAGGPRPVGSGRPRPNYSVALSAWQEAGAAAGIIVPMAGEICLARPAEVE